MYTDSQSEKSVIGLVFIDKILLSTLIVYKIKVEFRLLERLFKVPFASRIYFLASRLEMCLYFLQACQCIQLAKWPE
jgi:hypothetical protein